MFALLELSIYLLCSVLAVKCSQTATVLTLHSSSWIAANSSRMARGLAYVISYLVMTLNDITIYPFVLFCTFII